MNDAHANEAQSRFAMHYLQIFGCSLGVPTRILPDGTVQAHLETGVLHIANTAPGDLERLDLALVATLASTGELVDANPTASVVVAAQHRLPAGITLEQHPHHPELVIARLDTVLAGPDQLPDPALLVQVLPRLLDRLRQALETFATEATLAGITTATEADNTEADSRNADGIGGAATAGTD